MKVDKAENRLKPVFNNRKPVFQKKTGFNIPTLMLAEVSLYQDSSCLPLTQWCTTFFGQGPLLDFLNSSGAKQV